jgi:hypothetical protein
VSTRGPGRAKSSTTQLSAEQTQECFVQNPAARLKWRKSSACATQNCVQVAATGDSMIAVRNSSDPDGATVLYSAAEWRAFLVGAKNGEFDDLIDA